MLQDVLFFPVQKGLVEIWGIEPQTFHMQSERSTTELYPRYKVALSWLEFRYRFIHSTL